MKLFPFIIVILLSLNVCDKQIGSEASRTQEWEVAARLVESITDFRARNGTTPSSKEFAELEEVRTKGIDKRLISWDQDGDILYVPAMEITIESDGTQSQLLSGYYLLIMDGQYSKRSILRMPESRLGARAIIEVGGISGISGSDTKISVTGQEDLEQALWRELTTRVDTTETK